MKRKKLALPSAKQFRTYTYIGGTYIGQGVSPWFSLYMFFFHTAVITILLASIGIAFVMPFAFWGMFGAIVLLSIAAGIAQGDMYSEAILRDAGEKIPEINRDDLNLFQKVWRWIVGKLVKFSAPLGKGLQFANGILAVCLVLALTTFAMPLTWAFGIAIIFGLANAQGIWETPAKDFDNKINGRKKIKSDPLDKDLHLGKAIVISQKNPGKKKLAKATAIVSAGANAIGQGVIVWFPIVMIFVALPVLIPFLFGAAATTVPLFALILLQVIGITFGLAVAPASGFMYGKRVLEDAGFEFKYVEREKLGKFNKGLRDFWGGFVFTSVLGKGLAPLIAVATMCYVFSVPLLVTIVLSVTVAFCAAKGFKNRAAERFFEAVTGKVLGKKKNLKFKDVTETPLNEIVMSSKNKKLLEEREKLMLEVVEHAKKANSALEVLDSQMGDLLKKLK